MPEAAGLPDQAARDRVSADLATTLFVEAGAGSGKTSALVSRVLALVESGTAELRSVAAITFTERAAAELRDRIRRALEERAGSDVGDEVAGRCRIALDQLDGAPVATLHAFAHRLLSEHPIEAGLPPRVEVLDEVSSGVDFESRWVGFRDQLLSDPLLERTILLLLACGVRAEALRLLALAFDRDWDLVAERVPQVEPEPPDVASLLAPTLDALERACQHIESCRNEDDGLRRRLEEIADYIGRLRGLDDELDAVAALDPEAGIAPPSFRVGRLGRKTSWDLDLGVLRAELSALGEDLVRVRDRISHACVLRLGAAIRRFTLEAARERRRSGRLDFHDLLVVARVLLRDPEHGPSIRSRLHHRYTHILLDEFQDTDPIQIELAVRIAAANPSAPEAGERGWEKVAISPGQLFMVGDPKQSIYRFRRADIATFLRARQTIAADGGSVVELDSNFRSSRALTDWVNTVFTRLMAEPPEPDVASPSQPGYLPVHGLRATAPQGPAVSVLGRSAHAEGTTAVTMRSAEAAEVASAVTRILAEGWSVQDRVTGDWRSARLGDVTILVPARTSLPFLEDALESVSVPFRAESSSLVYATRAVRDLLMVLRAVDDPTDHLRIVAALRTPLFGCGDDDLVRFKVHRGGHWSYLARQPDTVPADDPVRRGLAYLRERHAERHWLAPSELLDRVARDRRVLELGFAERRPRDVWRRVRFATDQARAWSEATGGTLRDFLTWVDLQNSEGARVAEAILPETDDDAVRIMTIHAAKGLEFPITIVSGMSTVPSGAQAPAEVVFPADGGVGYHLSPRVTTAEYEAWKPIDEQMGFHERIRLLYVACTRARDHLVVSLHRKQRASAPGPRFRTNAELLVDGLGPGLGDTPDVLDGPGEPLAPMIPEPVEPPAPFREWAQEREAAMASSRLPGTVAATALTEESTPDPGVDPEPEPGFRKRPRDLDLPPWLKGRYGSAVGRAVHGVLQTIDLATGSDSGGIVASQCEAEAIPERSDDVARLVRAALESSSVSAAAGLPHWREVYVCTPVKGRLLEGYIDLLYRSPEGLVVVDYKTAAVADPQVLDRRVEGYRLQGASYALAVGASTGEPVSRVTFVFLTPDGAIERDLSDLDTVGEEVRALIGAGQEVLAD